MLTIGIGVLLGVLVAVRASFRQWLATRDLGPHDWLLGSSIAASFSVLVGTALGVGVAWGLGASQGPGIDTRVHELRSLRTVDSIEGVFALGSGSIEHSTVYHVLIQNPDGSLSPFSVPGDQVRIIEDETLHNAGELTITRKLPRMDLFTVYIKGNRSIAEDARYELRVPKGSVVSEFRVQ